MKHLKTIFITAILVAASALGLSALVPNSASAAGICDQDNLSPEIRKANGCDTGGADIQEVVVNVINGLLGAITVVLVIFIIVGGVNYMTSAGDANKLEKAKKTIIYAVVGAIICVLAFAITNFVISALKQAG